jgi:hypothetical protein
MNQRKAGRPSRRGPAGEPACRNLRRSRVHKHSSGVFTLAKPKLVQPFQLAKPSTFPLKWIQAAVRAECDRAELWSQIIRVRAVRPRQPLCLESLQRELHWPGSQEHSWLKDLALGLRAAMPRYPEVSVRSEGFSLHLARDGHSRIVRKDCESSEFLVIASHPNVDWHYGLSNLSSCRFAPIPIFERDAHAQADRYLEPGGFWGKNKLLQMHVIDPTLPDVDCVSGGPVPAANVAGTSVTTAPSPVLWRITHGEPARFLETTAAPLCRAEMRISAGLSGRGQLVFVAGGVSMQPISVDLGCPGCVCICSAAGLRIDDRNRIAHHNRIVSEKERCFRRRGLEQPIFV